MSSLRQKLTATLAVFLCCGGTMSFSQATGSRPVSSSSVPAPAGSTLGAGDEVTIQVRDLEEFTGKSFRVDPDGGFDLPLIGRMEVKGLTLSSFRQELSDRLSKYITSPQITVNLSESQSRPVSVIGEVNAPGVHQLQGSKNLIELISLAGGLKPDAGPYVIVTRQLRWGPLPLPGATTDAENRFSKAAIRLDDLLAAKSPAENITMLPDDVISVPKGELIYVVGNVHRAGGFPLASKSSISLLQALSLAEGLAPNAATSRAKILRSDAGSQAPPREIPVDLKKVLAGRAPDTPLIANDILFIPDSAAKAGSRRALDAFLQAATGVAIYAR